MMQNQQQAEQDRSIGQNVVELQNINKKFGDLTAVQNVNLSVRDGEILTLLGPSGCGKTTTLRMIAGFEKPSNGEIRLNGTDVSTVPPYKRDTGMVFQRYALFQHMTVSDNVAFGLKMQGEKNNEVNEKVIDMLKMVQLEDMADRYPAALSGGQQQRVALARSLVIQPSVLLLDEPLANLDKKLREEMRLEFLRIHEELDVTMVYVTHNQEEALTISDRMAVMSNGVIHQVGTPKDIYENPADRFVADFIGQATFLPGTVVEVGEVYSVELNNGTTIRVEDSSVAQSETIEKGKDVNISFRPQKLSVKPKYESETKETNQFMGKVDESTFLGDRTIYYILIGDNRIQAEEPNTGANPTINRGDEVTVTFKEDAPLILPMEDK